ncbi:MAG: hypothetical protein A2539_08500 [Elusimicrobia bacterium RIFOXYD2_FULL_34_15]|nr:MAG: hypothetical protein A2539_08500 [Elusimicrobia bacterium RIFOXYD2_FULL_34_15]
MIKSTYRLTDKGLTLVEVIVALAIFLIIVPVITSVLMNVTKGFTSFEASNSLKKTNQNTLNRIYLKLTESKKIFQNIPSDPTVPHNAYLGRIVANNYIVSGIGCPKLLENSKLPIVEEQSSLAQGTTNFTPSSVGNSLFFANSDSTKVLTNILDGAGISHTISIDLYKFNYYYLTEENPKPMRAMPSYRLVEWESLNYADYNQIINYTDQTLKNNMAISLRNNNILWSWDTTVLESNINNAFYELNTDGLGKIDVKPTHTIQILKYNILTDMNTGIMGGGYKYGISSNTTYPKKVPQYANALGKFPGGFEVAIVGPTSGRRVFLRCVILAQGSTPGILSDDQLVLCSARDSN